MRDNESDIFPPGEPPAAAQPATEQLRDVAQSLVDFQRLYAEMTWDTAPGNEHYGKMLMKIVEAARSALSLHPTASAVQPATNEQTDYQAALTALPDTLGRPLARRIEIVLEGLRRESHIGCELRRELDGGIERDARAIEAQWPDAAKYLRSHAHIEDGV